MALSARDGVYTEAAAALNRELAEDARIRDVKTAAWQELPSPALRPPGLIVTLGANAFRGMVERIKREPVLAGIPILAALLPQASYEALAPKAPFLTSAVFIDQPAERYLDLLRIALPERHRVGILFGPGSAALQPALNKAAMGSGTHLVQQPPLTERDDIYPTLSRILAEADVLLSLPDSHIFNAGSLRNILIASYRQRVPMVAFSEAYVKAGATLALYTSPAQAASQTAAAIRRYYATRNLPPPQLSAEFSVAVNADVARSLGLTMETAERLALALRRKEESR